MCQGCSVATDRFLNPMADLYSSPQSPSPSPPERGLDSDLSPSPGLCPMDWISVGPPGFRRSLAPLLFVRGDDVHSHDDRYRSDDSRYRSVIAEYSVSSKEAR